MRAADTGYGFLPNSVEVTLKHPIWLQVMRALATTEHAMHLEHEDRRATEEVMSDAQPRMTSRSLAELELRQDG